MAKALTLDEFLSWSGYCKDDVNLTYVSAMLDSIDEAVRDEIQEDFTTTVVDDTNVDFPYLDYYGSWLDTVKIGFWQPTNMTVTLGYFGGSPLITLVENRHYRKVYFKNRVNPNSTNNPVWGIRLRSFTSNVNIGYLPFYTMNNNISYIQNPQSFKVGADAFLRITGTKGFNGYPSDLKQFIFQLVKNRVEWTANQTRSKGSGLSQAERSRSLSITQILDPQQTESIWTGSFDIMNMPEARRLIYKYKQYTANNIKIS